MDNIIIPAPGTKFIYRRLRSRWGCPWRTARPEDLLEHWEGTVTKHWIDDIGEHVVETIQDDTGEVVTFWNGSFFTGDGLGAESVEVVQS